ncbi:MAG: hypothetical protein HY002_15120, partial [Candidatus Rokubacteria bacterium]|nr:hypothetical protein [Candidatus Rokubacteria bacterium]
MPAWAGEPPILHDVPEAVLVGLVTVLVLAGTWGVLDRRSRGAGLVRQTWR